MRKRVRGELEWRKRGSKTSERGTRRSRKSRRKEKEKRTTTSEGLEDHDAAAHGGENIKVKQKKLYFFLSKLSLVLFSLGNSLCRNGSN